MRSLILALVVVTIIILYYISTIVRIYYNYNKCNNYEFSSTRLNDIYPTLKAGDIILFKSIITFIHSPLTMGTFFDHVGIVIEKNNQLFILELSDIGTRLDYDVYSRDNYQIVAPLYERLQSHHGIVFIMPLEKELEQWQKQKMLQISDVPIEYDTSYFKQLLRGLIPSKCFKKKKVCIEYVGNILHELQLTDELYDGFFIQLPKKLLALQNKPINNNKYLEIIRIN